MDIGDIQKQPGENRSLYPLAGMRVIIHKIFHVSFSKSCKCTPFVMIWNKLLQNSAESDLGII